MRDLVAIPVEPEVVAAALDRHDDFRVQRRIRRMDRRLPGGPRPPTLTGLAVDVETTGTDHRRHEVIEVAMCRFLMNEHGRIVETGLMRDWFEQPAEPISAEITRLTGLTDDDVRGRVIPEGEATALLLGSDFVVAHNARFDRGFLEKKLPLGAGRPWVCSMHDVEWDEEGFGKRDLTALLGRIGLFFDAHRADADVDALLHLLDHPLDTGGTVVGRAVRNARRRTWTVDAVDAPFQREGGAAREGLQMGPREEGLVGLRHRRRRRRRGRLGEADALRGQARTGDPLHRLDGALRRPRLIRRGPGGGVKNPIR